MIFEIFDNFGSNFLQFLPFIIILIVVTKKHLFGEKTIFYDKIFAQFEKNVYFCTRFMCI